MDRLGTLDCLFERADVLTVTVGCDEREVVDDNGLLLRSLTLYCWFHIFRHGFFSEKVITFRVRVPDDVLGGVVRGGVGRGGVRDTREIHLAVTELFELLDDKVELVAPDLDVDIRGSLTEEVISGDGLDDAIEERGGNRRQYRRRCRGVAEDGGEVVLAEISLAEVLSLLNLSEGCGRVVASDFGDDLGIEGSLFEVGDSYYHNLCLLVRLTEKKPSEAMTESFSLSL